MSSLESFIAEFGQFCRDRDINRIMALNAPGEISGWGVGEHDVFPSRTALENNACERNRRIKQAECLQHPVMVFGEKPVACLLAQVEFVEHHFDNSTCKYSGFATWFLEWGDGAWHIRHGHFGIPLGGLDESIEFSYQTPVLGDVSERLDGSVMESLNSWLKKRSALMAAGDVGGMTNLLYPQGDIVLWGMCKGEECRSISEAESWYRKMFEGYSISTVYFDPVAFQCGDLICLSAHGEMTVGEQGSHNEITIKPLRSTFILQKFEGEWRARHVHVSVPVNI